MCEWKNCHHLLQDQHLHPQVPLLRKILLLLGEGGVMMEDGVNVG